MLSALGIIAEYNPFHNGHRYLIRKAKSITGADVVVTVMSGNWVQRGKPAILDKWHRTQMALKNGVDLVIELPSQFAVQSAEPFADKAFQLIDSLKCDELAFGCEHPDLNFNRLARAKISHRYFKNPSGRSYADLYRRAFLKKTGVKIDQPDDILGLNYARAKLRRHSNVRLLPIARCYSVHADKVIKNERFANATTLRSRYQKGLDIAKWIPRSCLGDWNESIVTWRSLWPFLRLALIEKSLISLEQIYQMREGLEYRLKRAALNANTFQQFMKLVKTKRYTYSRLLRLFFYVLTDLTDNQWQSLKIRDYLRILGFDQKGRQYLNQIKKSVSIPMISNVGKFELTHELRFELKAGMPIQMLDHRYQDLFQHPIVK